MVPDESERRAITIVVSGSVTPEFCAAIAGSFHFVILPWKMFASVGAVELQLLVDAGEVVRDRDRADHAPGSRAPCRP